MGGAAVCYSYSCSKGAFAGLSIEGSLLTTRNDVNLNFYGGWYSRPFLLAALCLLFNAKGLGSFMCIACTATPEMF